MQPLTINEILKATGGTLLQGNSEAVISGVGTDSRKTARGDLFIPLKGERFDGHDYISQAVESGAAAFLTSHDVPPGISCTAIRVEDTLKGLQDLASYYRSKFKIRFAAITGSVGKTSTKDMVASVLKQQYNVLSTQGNLNNEIGLPLTLFDLDESHEAAVVELGMSGFGEISCLTGIVRPDIAIITNIGLSHIEKLGSRQNILKAKMEIFEGLSRDGLAVLNGDDELLSGLRDLIPFRTVYYGLDEHNDIQAYHVKNAGENGIYFSITYNGTDYNVHIPVPGVHNLYNALAAIAVGIEMKMPFTGIIKGIAEFKPSKMRLNIIVCSRDVKVINDAYNASPTSMTAALDVLADISKSRRKIAILGDMLEMGEWARDAHRNVGRHVSENKIDYLITVGENGRNIALGALEAGMEKDRIVSFDANSEVNTHLKDFLTDGDMVLVKGSRGMKMEEIVDFVAGELFC